MRYCTSRPMTCCVRLGGGVVRGNGGVERDLGVCRASGGAASAVGRRGSRKRGKRGKREDGAIFEIEDRGSRRRRSFI